MAVLEIFVLEEFSLTASSPCSPEPSCSAEIPKIAYVRLVNRAPVRGVASWGQRARAEQCGLGSRRRQERI